MREKRAPKEKWILRRMGSDMLFPTIYFIFGYIVDIVKAHLFYQKKVACFRVRFAPIWTRKNDLFVYLIIFSPI